MINRKMNVLVIDDDQVDRAIYSRILNNSKEFSFNIIEATTAEKAIELLNREKDTIDCILLDYQLPDSDGIEVLSKIKKIGIKYTPVIFLTGQGSEHIAVCAMKSGATDYIPKGKFEPDLLIRTVVNAIKNEQLKKTIDEQKQKIKYFSYYDTLTGLLNRHTFEEMLYHDLIHAEKTHHSLSVILIDLDNFMAINDSVGHLAGNAILIEVAKRLTSSFSSDTCISRYGEDEFAIIWQDDKNEKSQIKSIAKAIKDAISEPYEISNNEFFTSLRVSIGIASFPDSGQSVSDLLKCASAALSQSKKSGGDFITCY